MVWIIWIIISGGFPNYFGLQRFGTGQQPSSSLGLALLRASSEDVVRLALGARARHGRALEVQIRGRFGRSMESMVLVMMNIGVNDELVMNMLVMNRGL